MHIGACELTHRVKINTIVQRIIVNIFLPLIFYICFRCSKEPSQYHNIHVEPKTGTLVFKFLFDLKHKKDMESRSISGVTPTCRNPCRSPVRHSCDDMTYLYSQNLLPFLLKKCKRSLIFVSAYIFVFSLKISKFMFVTHSKLNASKLPD